MHYFRRKFFRTFSFLVLNCVLYLARGRRDQEGLRPTQLRAGIRVHRGVEADQPEVLRHQEWRQGRRGP